MSRREKFTVILTDQVEKGWLCGFFNENAGFGPVLEQVFDARLIDNPDRSQFEFEAPPENKDKLVYTFKQSVADYFSVSPRTGEYFSFEKEDLEQLARDVKKMASVPQLT